MIILCCVINYNFYAMDKTKKVFSINEYIYYDKIEKIIIIKKEILYMIDEESKAEYKQKEIIKISKKINISKYNYNEIIKQNDIYLNTNMI